MPQISILLQTYNQAPFLEESVESLLAQTFRDFELVIVDDRSTDTTQAVLERYRREPRITLIDNSENLGQNASLNHHLPRLKGRAILFASGDDVYYPELLAKQIAALEQYPAAGMVHVNARVIDDEGKEQDLFSHRYGDPFDTLLAHDHCLPGRDLLRYFVRRNIVASHSTAMVRRSALDHVGPFDEALPQLADWDMWLRIACAQEIAYLAEPLVGWRRHDESASIHLHASGLSLTNQLTLARRMLDELPTPVPTLAREEPDVWVWGFLEPAWFSYYASNIQEAQSRLVEGTRYFPAWDGAIEVALTSLISWAREKIDAQSDGHSPLGFIRSVVNRLPPIEPFISVTESQATTMYWQAEAFAAHDASDAPRVRSSVVRALMSDRRAWQNRGLFSIYARSVLGNDIWDRLHTLLKPKVEKQGAR